MEKTVKTSGKPRPERRSRSFSSLRGPGAADPAHHLQFPTVLPSGSSKARRTHFSTRTEKPRTALEELDMLKGSTSMHLTEGDSSRFLHKQAPPTGSNSDSLPPPKAAAEGHVLEPITEASGTKLSELLELKIREKQLKESDIQEMLLSYTLTSGDIDSRIMHTFSRSKTEDAKKVRGFKYHPFASVIALIKAIVAKSVELFHKLQAKIFEVFWITLIYVNVWFPKFVDYIRYVSFQFLRSRRRKEEEKSYFTNKKRRTSLSTLHTLEAWVLSEVENERKFPFWGRCDTKKK